MKGGGEDAVFIQFVGQHFRCMALGDEDQRTFPLAFFIALLDQCFEQLGAACAVYGNGALGDAFGAEGIFGLGAGINLHLHRVVQQALRQAFHILRIGGRKQQGLALAWQQGQHALQLFGKAQIEQAVGFVQHQVLYLVELDGIAFHQVEQTTGRGDQKIGAAAQLHHLRVDGDTAKDDAGARLIAQLAAQGLQRFVHLQGQFTRGREDQRAQVAHKAAMCLGLGRLEPELQQRQQVGQGLARARGRAGLHVTAFEHGADGLLLNRGGLLHAQFFGGVGNRGDQAERGKGHGGGKKKNRGWPQECRGQLAWQGQALSMNHGIAAVCKGKRPVSAAMLDKRCNRRHGKWHRQS